MTQSQRRYLHVANGTSTARTIEAAGIPGDVSIWADPLYEGPVPAVPDEELIQLRASYLAGTQQPALAVANELRAWRAALEAPERGEEVILWYEHDLFDQLNLVQLLAWLDERGHGATISLVCIGSYPGHSAFKGLGELAPRELAPLFATRQPVSEKHYAVAQRTWRAFREPSPQALSALRGEDTAVLPYLHAAIGRFLQEYPWTGDGLSRTERRLMQIAGAGAVALSGAFPRMHEGENAYYVTDLSLEHLVEALSLTTPPLLAVEGAEPGRVLARSVALTAAGRAVLEGRHDRVATCGIDRWLGGVHLEGREGVWRWDEERKAVTRQ